MSMQAKQVQLAWQRSYLSRIRWKLTVTCLLLLLAAKLETANAGTSYPPYAYDLAPIFTPDGRLLSVEYAGAAADHSFPVIIARLAPPKASQQPQAQASSSSILVAMAVQPLRAVQDRLVILPGSSPTLVALSGIWADNYAWLQGALEEQTREWYQYGRPQCAQQVARALARLAQSHASGGGLRPFGGKLLVAGCTSPPPLPISTNGYSLFASSPSSYDEGLDSRRQGNAVSQSQKDSDYAPLLVQQVDPSGSLQDMLPDTPFWILGGSSNQRAGLQQRLSSLFPSQSANDDNKDDGLQVESDLVLDSTDITDSLARLAQSLLQEYSKEDTQKPSEEAVSKGQTRNAVSSSPSARVDVVIISPRKGVFRLPLDAVQELLQRHASQEPETDV
jgi:Proteasome subunit